MEKIALNDEVYDKLFIIKRTEFENLAYKSPAVFDQKIQTAYLPGYGTTLFCENRHFIVISDREPVKRYAVWRNHKVIGYCDITRKAAEKANRASNAVFYFGFDRVTNPEKYEMHEEG